jgi:hypothetical protein
LCRRLQHLITHIIISFNARGVDTLKDETKKSDLFTAEAWYRCNTEIQGAVDLPEAASVMKGVGGGG